MTANVIDEAHQEPVVKEDAKNVVVASGPALQDLRLLKSNSKAHQELNEESSKNPR